MAMMTGGSKQQQQQEDDNDDSNDFGELWRMGENARSMMMMAMSTTSRRHRGNSHDGAAGPPILTHSPKFSKVVVRTGTVVVVACSSG